MTGRWWRWNHDPEQVRDFRELVCLGELAFDSREVCSDFLILVRTARGPVIFDLSVKQTTAIRVFFGDAPDHGETAGCLGPDRQWL